MRNLLLICICCLSIACTKSYDFNGVLKMERIFREKSTEMETAKDSLKFREQAEELISVYKIYAQANPQNIETGEFLYKAAGLSEAFLKNDAEAVKMYEQVFERFPNDQSGMMALFRAASIYQNKLKQKDKAKEKYTTFIAQYPTSFQAMQAKMAIEEMSTP